jgi:hypothetical protein
MDCTAARADYRAAAMIGHATTSTDRAAAAAGNGAHVDAIAECLAVRFDDACSRRCEVKRGGWRHCHHGAQGRDEKNP